MTVVASSTLRAASSPGQKTLQPGKDAAHRHDIDLHDHAFGDAPVVLHEMQQPFAAPGHGFQRFLGIGQFGPRGIIGRKLGQDVGDDIAGGCGQG